MSRKHRSIALRTIEVEYIAANEACRKVLWIPNLFAELFNQELELTVMYYNNQSCVKLSQNPMFHDRSKHIEIMYHYIYDMLQRRVIRLCYISTDE